MYGQIFIRSPFNKGRFAFIADESLLDLQIICDLIQSSRRLNADDLLTALRSEPALRSRWRKAVPARIVRVAGLSQESLAAAAASLYPYAGSPSFLTTPPDHFETALIPVGDPPDRFILFIDERLKPSDVRLALAHAIGHLLLGHLRPGDTNGHWDILAEIRAGKDARRRWDREAGALTEDWVKRETLEVPDFQIDGLREAWQRLFTGDIDEPHLSALLLALSRRNELVDVTEEVVRKADLFPHQARGAAEMVVRLRRLNVGLLADSVGLGKTRTTATILRLLRDRGEMRRAAILTPRKLERNWRKELSLLELRADGSRNADVKIINKDVFKRKSPREAADELRDCDLIVVEEAHQDMRNHGNRFHRNLREAAGVSRRGLLVTATPWNNRRGDIFAMLQPFIRPQPTEPREIFGCFTRGFRSGRKEFEESDEIFNQVYARTVLQRTRRQLRESGDARVHYAQRQPFLITVPYDQNQRDAFNRLLTRVEALRLPYFNPIRYLVAEADAENRLSNTHRFFLLKRAESSMVAFEKTLHGMAEKARQLMQELEKIPETDQAVEAWLRSRYNIPDPAQELDADQTREGELLFERVTTTRQRRILTILRQARAEKNLRPLRARLITDCQADIAVIDAIREDFQEMFGHDLKLQEVLDLIHEQSGRGEKVLLVSQFADTAFALYKLVLSDDRLRTKGVGLIMSTAKGGEEPVQIDGWPSDRETVLRRFAPAAWRESEIEGGRGLAQPLIEETPINILIGTDTLSVGQNLQDARCLIHLDLTWNPMVLEQRIGRLDRPRHKGDNAPIEIYYLLNLDLIETELRLRQRLEARLEATYRDTAFDDEIMPGYFELIEHYRRLRQEREQENGYIVEADEILQDLAASRPPSLGDGTVEADRAALQTLLQAMKTHLDTENEPAISEPLVVTVGKSVSGFLEAAAEYELLRYDVNNLPIGEPERGLITLRSQENPANSQVHLASLAPMVQAFLSDPADPPKDERAGQVTGLFRQIESSLLAEVETYKKQRNQAQKQMLAAAEKARPAWLNQLIGEIQNAIFQLTDEEYQNLLDDNQLDEDRLMVWLDALRAGVDTDDPAGVEQLRSYLGRPKDALSHLRELYELILAEEALDESAGANEIGALNETEARQLELDLQRVVARVESRIINIRVNLPD